MNKPLQSMLSDGATEALLTARYEDVFSVLGMHEHPTGSGLIARVLLPGASAVDVIATRDNRKVDSEANR